MKETQYKIWKKYLHIIFSYIRRKLKTKISVQRKHSLVNKYVFFYYLVNKNRRQKADKNTGTKKDALKTL